MAEAYCPRCGRAMSGGTFLCPTCTEELNAIAAGRRRMMSLVFTLALLVALFALYRSGRLGGLLKIFTTLKL